MMLLGLIVLFLVIRPLVKRILASDEVAAAISGVLTGPAASDDTAPSSQPLLPGAAASAIDVATIQGQVHAQSVHRVGELAERNPNETVAIIRQWLTEPAK
jgi:flagellar M-ring protein FliF